VNQQTVPDYLQPQVQQLVGQAQSLTDPTQNPFPCYIGNAQAGGQGIQGTTVAGFNPLQNQAFGNIQNMQPSGLNNTSAGMAGLAGTLAGNIGQSYQPGQIGYNQTGVGSFTNPGTAQSYMSPYEQNVIQQQMNQAQQSYAQGLPQMGALAAANGDLGGTRQALVGSQAASNEQQQLQNIQATGLQNAFSNAQNQFNTENQLGFNSQQANQGAALNAQNAALQSQQFGAGLGLQGLQTQLSAAGQLGNIGQQNYAQLMGINQAQTGAGATVQSEQQAVNNALNQNYQNAVNYPYAQQQFLSGIIHGTSPGALGAQTTQSQYTQAPNVLGQVAGLGTAAAGLGSLV
jgi:hypothetical protein